MSTRAVGAAIVLLAATFTCYIPALRGGFIWDDDRHVSENRMLLDLHGLRQIWLRPGVTPQYYPMTHTSFWIEYRAWRLNPAGYHVTNVLLHASNAVLLWRLLVKLSVPGAFLAAAIFAVHPVNVESVAWISERKNVLAAAFMLLSIHSYLRPGRVAYVASFALFACALFSKTVTCTMPAVIVLILWWKQKLERREIAKLVPFFILGIVMGLMTARMERSYVGASGADWDLSFAQRCIIAARAIWFYAGKLLWPAQLTFSYPRWQIDPAHVSQWLPVIGLLITGAVLLRNRERIGRGPIAGVFIFIGTLFPALGFFNTYPMRYSFIADHFQYISSAAMIALVVAVMLRVRVRAGAITLLIPLLGALTWSQARVYASAETIWRDTIAKNPTSWMARHNLAVVLSARADEDIRAGRHEAAMTRLNESLALLDETARLRPEHEKVAFNRAEVLRKMVRYDDALGIFRAELQKQPQNARLMNQIGVVLDAMGRTDDAIDSFRKAIAANPGLPEPYINLAGILERRGRLDDALMTCEAGVRAAPDDAPVRLAYGTLLYRPQINRLTDAAAQFEAYLKLQRGDADAHATLGFIYGELARYDDARREFRAALRIDANHENAQRGMKLLSGR